MYSATETTHLPIQTLSLEIQQFKYSFGNSNIQFHWPYSYSQYWTGTTLQWRLIGGGGGGGREFQMQMAYCVECGNQTRDTLVENPNRPCSSSSIHSDFLPNDYKFLKCSLPVHREIHIQCCQLPQVQVEENKIFWKRASKNNQLL